MFANEFGVAADGTNQASAIRRAVVAAAAAGKTLVFPPGTYTLTDVELPTGTHIRGFGANTVLRRPAGTSGASVLTVNATDDVTIEDLSIDANGASDPPEGDGAIDIFEGDGITVRNVTITDSPGFGIRIAGNSNGILIEGCSVINPDGPGINYSSASAACDSYVVRNCLVDRGSNLGRGIGYTINTPGEIRGTRITGNRVIVPVAASGAIPIECLGTGVMEDTVVSDNVLYAGSIGISLAGGSTSAVISGNLIIGTTTGGIEAAEIDGATVVGNTIEVAEGLGITINSSIDTSVTGNVVRGFDTAGIRFFNAVRDQENISVTGNVVVGTGGTAAGIYVQGNDTSYHAVIVGNVVDDALDGVLFDGVADVHVVGNRVRNVTNGVRIDSGGTVTGVIVGNDFLDAVTTPINIVGGTTVGQLHRWANAGIRPIVTGSRGGNAALADLLAELEGQGVIDDQSS